MVWLRALARGDPFDTAFVRGCFPHVRMRVGGSALAFSHVRMRVSTSSRLPNGPVRGKLCLNLSVESGAFPLAHVRDSLGPRLEREQRD